MTQSRKAGSKIHAGEKISRVYSQVIESGRKAVAGAFAPSSFAFAA